MTEGHTGRPGGPGRPHRFYFDDLADEPASAAPTTTDQTETDVDEHFDDLVDTGPIQVILDPLPGSAAQQLHLDDLTDEPEAAQPEPVEPVEADEAAAAGQLYFDDLDGVLESEPAGHVPPPWETDNRPAALALNGGRRRPRPVGAVLALIVVLALVAIIAAISTSGNGGHSRRDTAQVSKPKVTAPAAGQATNAPTQSASGPRSSAPAHSTAPSHRSSAAPTTAPAGIPLTVLNNTTESGLARTAAQAFSTKGWQVGTVGNYTGQISVTTVYYNPSDPAQHKAAETLARQYPGVAQVQPRFADLPGTGLTLVLAPGWHL